MTNKPLVTTPQSTTGSPALTVVEAVEAARRDRRPLIACDVSPPRGAVIETLPAIAEIPADFYCAAYAPGRAVRLDSLVMARITADATGRGAIFNLATRDMNLLALQNHLLGAEAMGVPNVVVVRGDDLTPRDLTLLTAVHNATPTDLIRAIVAMNQGQDCRGSALRAPTHLCVGATLDLARGVDHEAVLTARKVEAGAMFLITQPVYAPEEVEQFLAAYRRHTGSTLDLPVLWGFPVLAKDSITFGTPPEHWRRDLDAGRSGTDLAAEQLRRFFNAGLTALYVMPPILRGGARDYAAAAEALRTVGH